MVDQETENKKTRNYPKSLEISVETHKIFMMMKPRKMIADEFIRFLLRHGEGWRGCKDMQKDVSALHRKYRKK